MDGVSTPVAPVQCHFAPSPLDTSLLSDGRRVGGLLGAPVAPGSRAASGPRSAAASELRASAHPLAAENHTGMPDRLKAGLEQVSGLDLSGVRVHYNSAKPAQLNALAYAQGRTIEVGPGQERHLPHEGWHVVQQMHGRVRPTVQPKGVGINDDATLEREADLMGVQAWRGAHISQQRGGAEAPATVAVTQRVGHGVIQRTATAFLEKWGKLFASDCPENVRSVAETGPGNWEALKMQLPAETHSHWPALKVAYDSAPRSALPLGPVRVPGAPPPPGSERPATAAPGRRNFSRPPPGRRPQTAPVRDRDLPPDVQARVTELQRALSADEREALLAGASDPAEREQRLITYAHTLIARQQEEETRQSTAAVGEMVAESSKEVERPDWLSPRVPAASEPAREAERKSVLSTIAHAGRGAASTVAGGAKSAASAVAGGAKSVASAVAGGVQEEVQHLRLLKDIVTGKEQVTDENVRVLAQRSATGRGAPLLGLLWGRDSALVQQAEFLAAELNKAHYGEGYFATFASGVNTAVTLCSTVATLAAVTTAACAALAFLVPPVAVVVPISLLIAVGAKSAAGLLQLILAAANIPRLFDAETRAGAKAAIVRDASAGVTSFTSAGVYALGVFVPGLDNIIRGVASGGAATASGGVDIASGSAHDQLLADIQFSLKERMALAAAKAKLEVQERQLAYLEQWCAFLDQQAAARAKAKQRLGEDEAKLQALDTSNMEIDTALYNASNESQELERQKPETGEPKAQRVQRAAAELAAQVLPLT